EQHVRPDVAGDEVNLVGLDELLGLLDAYLGLLLIVLVNHLDRQAPHLAAQMVERKLDRVSHVVADHGGRAAERAFETYFSASLLGRSRCGREHGDRGGRKKDAPHLQTLPNGTMAQGNLRGSAIRPKAPRTRDLRR